ncbi:MAG: lipoate--protein ligase [Ruminococcaceae bacterium]|nr:lipoate--protein ligase [Oscillospiraceae bacterium]
MIYIDTKSQNIYYNLAMEYWLVTEKKPSDTVLLFWNSSPTLVVGKYQNPLEEINIEYAKTHNINICRRMSGGGTVYQDPGCWQFSFITKSENEGIDFKQFILPVIDVLHDMGVPGAGFNGRNDLVIEGKKFSGNSQYIHGGYTVHHGTLLYATDMVPLVESTTVDPQKIISKSIKSVRDRVTNISEHMEKPLPGEVFKEKMVAGLLGDGAVYDLTAEERDRVQKIADEKFNNYAAIYGGSPKYSIQRKGYFTGGKMEFNISVAKGLIKDISVTGDFFGTVESEDFALALKGCPYEKSAVVEALGKMPGEVYRISKEEMAGLIVV